MKSIAYIIPYFGKFPKGFEIWLHSCKYNPTIDWIIFTDDIEDYDYPQNVKVNYIKFNELKEKIQRIFNFKIKLSDPYKLCDYKVAYGEIFEEELKGYDFWGYCDIDLIWGDIRTFITDEVLETYERIGFQGHSTLYKNDKNVNARYKTLISEEKNLEAILNSRENMFFDENIMNKLYIDNNIKFFNKTIFANISPLTYNFYLRYFPNEMDYKNKNQIFIWENGKLLRVYYFEGKIYQEEFMYVHFLRREMKVLIKDINDLNKFAIVPNKICMAPTEVDINYIVKNSKNNMILYYINLLKRKWRKISFKNIYKYFKHRVNAKKNRKYNNEGIIIGNNYEKNKD